MVFSPGPMQYEYGLSKSPHKARRFYYILHNTPALLGVRGSDLSNMSTNPPHKQKYRLLLCAPVDTEAC